MAICQHRDNTVLEITRPGQSKIGSLLNVNSVTAYGGLEIELHGFLISELYTMIIFTLLLL
jgi:hypothetical protein